MSSIPVPITHRVDAPSGGQVLVVVNHALEDAAHLPAQQVQDEANRARGMAGLLYQRLLADPAWPTRRAEGAAEFRWLLAQAAARRGPLTWLLAHSLPPAAARAGDALSTVMDHVVCRAIPVVVDGELREVAADLAVYGFLDARRASWLRSVESMLAASAEPRDAWHVAAALPFWLTGNPTLALRTVHPAFSLAPRPAGQSDLERQAEVAVGAPDRTERLAMRYKRGLQAQLGYVAPRRKPGPKGGRRQANAARTQFEQYVVGQLAAGRRSYQIQRDPEAKALYRAWKRDQEARLSANAIAYVRRKHAGTPEQSPRA